MQHGEKTGPSFEQTHIETFRLPLLTHSLKIKTPLKVFQFIMDNLFQTLFLNKFFYRHARKKYPSFRGRRSDLRLWGGVEDSWRQQSAHSISCHLLPQFPPFSPSFLRSVPLSLLFCLSLCICIPPNPSIFFFFQLKLVTTSSCSKFKPAVGGY